MNFINKLFKDQFKDKIFCNLPILFWANSIIGYANPNDLGFIIPYGGYMENRKDSMQDTYLKEKETFVHLGVDFWVPSGTELYIPDNQKFINVYQDKDQNGGWGGIALFETKDHYFIYAHLDICDRLIIGKEDVNGGWYPHLHIQAISKKEFNRLGFKFNSISNLINLIDGYAKECNIGLINLFPDPLPLL